METRGSKKQKEEDTGERHDPFAIDLFGEGLKAEVQGVLKSVKAKPLPDGVTRNWHDSLETLTAGRTEGSVETPAYPSWLETVVNGQLMPSLRKLVSPLEGPVHFEIISFEDTPADRMLGALKESANLFVKFEFGGETGLISISTALAGEIIDGVLSGPGNKIEDLRPLSKIELAICEYVAGSALSKLNNSIEGDSRLTIMSVENEAPDPEIWSDRMVEIVADLAVGTLSGMVSILMSFKMADSLNAAFKNAVSSGGHVEKPSKVDGLIAETNIVLKIGSTQVPAIEIPFLEPQDIVLVSSPSERWWEGGSDLGNFVCFAGASSNIRLEGRVEISSDERTTRFEVLEAVCESAPGSISRILERKRENGAKNVAKENEKAGSESDAEVQEAIGTAAEADASNDHGLVALENVMVDLRVQVAGRKISLGELGKIHAGQIIDLGCRPEDPVELIAESSDRPIASGELVKIEDQLGVRVTKVFV